MVAGRGYWIIIWFGIMFLGLVGLGASLYWARETGWRNVDELLRAVGTILVSIGMILILYEVVVLLGQALLIVALICFVLAFVFGRRFDTVKGHAGSGDGPDDTLGKSS